MNINNPEIIQHFHCSPESLTEFNSRYKGFGKELFQLLFKSSEELGYKITFYKGKLQAEEAYACLSNDSKTIAIQLDPHCAVIPMWDDETSYEVGGWCETPIEEALYAIKHWEEMKASSWKNMPFG